MRIDEEEWFSLLDSSLDNIKLHDDWSFFADEGFEKKPPRGYASEA